MQAFDKFPGVIPWTPVLGGGFGAHGAQHGPPTDIPGSAYELTYIPIQFTTDSEAY